MRTSNVDQNGSTSLYYFNADLSIVCLILEPVKETVIIDAFINYLLQTFSALSQQLYIFFFFSLNLTFSLWVLYFFFFCFHCSCFLSSFPLSISQFSIFCIFISKQLQMPFSFIIIFSFFFPLLFLSPSDIRFCFLLFSLEVCFFLIFSIDFSNYFISFS